MPNVVDIIQSIQVPQLIKDEHINIGKPILDNRGRPIHYTGGFAVVFPFLVNGSKWAFRCWSADIGDVEKRLHTLSKELKHLQLPYFCDFSYEPIGIIIGGKAYPTTRMQWIDGNTIKDYLCDNRNDTKMISKLANNFLKMCETLHNYDIAHGDLQHGNILVDATGHIFLIDYDSVYLPALNKADDIISGLPDYQHPKRKENKDASEKLDYFSELVIYLSIRAIAENPSLVEKYQVKDADRMLFSKEDYEDLKHSHIYQDIILLGNEFVELLSILEIYLSKNSISELEPFENYLLANKIVFSSSELKAIRNEQEIVINWDVPFEADVTLLQNEIAVPECNKLKGSYTTKLAEDAKFELVVIQQKKKGIIRELSIKVFDECKMDFSADKYYVFPTIPVVLSWNVKNAKIVWMDSEEVEAIGSKVIEPEKAMTCILSAEDEFGIKEKRIDIQMLPIPQIKTLMAPMPNFVSNMAVTIQQPRYNVDVKFPRLNIDWIKVDYPEVPSFMDLGLYQRLFSSPPLPKINLMSLIKKVFNLLKRK